MVKTASTGYVYHPAYLLHDPGPYPIVADGTPRYPYEDVVPHFEGPLRVKRVKELLDLTGLASKLREVPARSAEVEDLYLYHTREHVRRVVEIATVLGYGDAGEFAHMSRGSYEVALLAVGGVMAAVDAVLEGSVRNCYALIRPCGHHAVADRGMGFCLFNNVALAARHAQRRGGAERILILDWDVHHGNGTQAAFYDDPSVLFISLHQDNLYPQNSGLVGQDGEGKGKGFTVNLPLPAGTGDAGYLAAFERVVVPIAKQYAPDLVLISSGLDASAFDPLGRMVVTAEGFRTMTRQMKALADEFAEGRLVIAHEGGYSWHYAPICALAIIEELFGERTAMSNANGEYFAALPPSKVASPDVLRAIDEIIEFQRRHWNL